ncbi:MAG: transporter, family, multidrug resistance protein [Subtercola sp.]|nr:transporter, family, multidrug resistance protein [Subtercola sp.]
MSSGRDAASSAPAEHAVTFTFTLLATLTVVLALTPYSVDAFLPAFPTAVQELGTTTSTMQLTLTAFLIGIAGGQLVFGPISDRFGRRGPLLLGSALCAAAAITAALAPTVGVLIVARLFQGIAGSAAMVICKAMIRDRTSGGGTTRLLSLITVASGALNIFAPIIGGVLVREYGWRGPLWFIAGLAVFIFVIMVIVVPETSPVELRHGAGKWLGFASMIDHLKNRTFVVYVVIQAGSYGTLLAYVSASPFVYQNVLGFDSTSYGILFAVNAACGVLANFIANNVLRHVGPKRLVMWGLGLSMTGTLLVAATWSVDAPSPVIAACITLSMAPLGLNGPNLVGLALNQVSHATGSAAATLGFTQFLTGSLVSPVVGLWGDATLIPCLVAMLTLAGGSMLFMVLSHRSDRALRAVSALEE